MRQRFRPSPALVIACLALAVALGGTSYAAFRLPANSVGVKQLKKNAVIGSKVKDDSLTGADILELSLGKVPSAANADSAANATNAANANNASSLGGVPSTGYARSDRVLTGSALDYGSPVGTRILLDPATGAEVRYHGTGEIEIQNTNAYETLDIHGVSSLSTNTQGQAARLTPGQNAYFPESAVPPGYLDLIVIKIGTSANNAVALHLTCGTADN